MQRFPGINKGLKDGARIEGLYTCVGYFEIRMAKGENTLGYGKMKVVENALLEASNRIIHSGMMAEATPVTVMLGRWLRERGFFVSWYDNEVVFQLQGMTRVEIPKDIKDRVLSTGTPETWEHRGYAYRVTRDQLSDAEGLHVAIEITNRPNGEYNDGTAWYYWISKTGRGSDFLKAMESAFKAEEIEIEKERVTLEV